MKFKVEPKDFVLFCIYCILLLYLCAIAVLNFTSLINEGRFYGLLPFKAFTLEYLPLTIMTFIIVLIVVFASVTSYIFSRDKNSHGIGLNIKEKSSDGYSRWAKDKEIKKSENVVKVRPEDKEVEAAGIPLINNGREIWVDNGEYHNLVIGSTGSGKSQTIVNPMVNLLAKKGESMIITDPKGELYKYGAEFLKQKGYNIIILNFRDPQSGNSWNPLALPYAYYKNGNIDKATELLDDVALNILYDPSNKSDSDFWEKSAADYFSGLALGLFMDADEKEVNLNSINLMSTVGEERYANSNYIKEYFNLKGPNSSSYIFASNTINAPNETKGGILSTFRQKIRKFSTQENLSEMLSYSDFDMREIGNGKTAVFMIIHDEKKTYHSLMTIFIKQCYETLIDVAQEKGGKLPFRTNFILDEFANMPPLKDVDSMVSAARSRDIRFTFIIQNFAQLNDVYGQEVAEVIRGNCGNLVYLISTELKALEEISKMCGEVKITDEKDKNATRPLVSISDLQKMKLFEAIIIRLRTNPYRTRLEPDFKMNWGIERIPGVYPKREKRLIQTFDLKKYVTEEKSKKMSEMNNNLNNGMNNGFGGSFGMPGGFGGNMGMGGFNSGFNPGFNPSPNFSPFAPTTSSSNLNNANANNNINTLDIDAMLKDLDEKFKQLDSEEEGNRKKIQAETKDDLDSVEKPKLINPFVAEENDDPLFSIVDDEEKVEEPKAEFKKDINAIKTPEVQKPDESIETLDPIDKPKINVDADSIIVNENVITDDEFFDDFFGDD